MPRSVKRFNWFTDFRTKWTGVDVIKRAGFNECDISNKQIATVQLIKTLQFIQVESCVVLFYLRNRIRSSCGSSLRLCRALLNDGKRSITIASRVQLQQQRNGVIGSTKVWLSFHWLIIYDDHPRYFFPFNSDQQERPRTLLTKQPLKICIRSIEIYKRTTAKFPPKKPRKWTRETSRNFREFAVFSRHRIITNSAIFFFDKLNGHRIDLNFKSQIIQ